MPRYLARAERVLVNMSEGKMIAEFTAESGEARSVAARWQTAIRRLKLQGQRPQTSGDNIFREIFGGCSSVL